MDTPTFAAIILAAGKGTRYGKEKQHEMLLGKPIWRWSHDAFQPLVDEIIVVGVDIPGGTRRRDSIYTGLQKINSQYVIVHDAVRPLVQEAQIKAMKQALIDGHQSVSFSFPSVDTIILDDTTYLDRSKLKRLQVPQGFDTQLLREAHEKSDQRDVTDDCQLMQQVHGINPHLLLGGVNLHKLTYPGDLAILEVLCQQDLS